MCPYSLLTKVININSGVFNISSYKNVATLIGALQSANFILGKFYK